MQMFVYRKPLQFLSVATAWEAWSRFLWNGCLLLLDQLKCKQVIFLTGDRHVGGIYKYGKYYELTQFINAYGDIFS